MGIQVSAVDALQQYIKAVMAKADHHAKGVDEIALAVAGAVLWRNERDFVEVRPYKGKPANALRMVIGGSVYSLSFNHINGTIEVKENNLRGKLLAAFTNKNTIAEVKAFFERL